MRLRPRRLSRWHLAIKALGERRRPVAVRRTEALRQLTDTTVSEEYHHLLPHSSYINPKPALNSPSTETQLECPVPDPAAAPGVGVLTYPCIDAATAHPARMLDAWNLHLLSLSLKAKTRH
jgi:hypothetical protein